MRFADTYIHSGIFISVARDSRKEPKMETIEYGEPERMYLVFYGDSENPCKNALFGTKDAAMAFAHTWDSIDGEHWARANKYSWLAKIEK